MGMLLRVAGRSTNVELRGVPGADLHVDGGDVIARDDGSVDITPRASTVRITCAEDVRATISTSSGRVRVHGHVADVRIITSSGEVVVERAVDIDVRTESGRVTVGECVHCCRVVTTSGTVSVTDAHDVGVSTTSARVEVGRAALAQVCTVSGTVSVGGESAARVQAKSISGGVTVTVPRGTAATTSLHSTSGTVHNDVELGDGAHLAITTMSGSIRVSER
jgi:DUF4097 and DUF4098 domain-containing protein YvlB